MISKSKIKYIKYLQLKKNRQTDKLFLVEGAKNIAELLNSDYQVVSLFLTNEFFICYRDKIEAKSIETEICTPEQLTNVSNFNTNKDGIAIVKMVENIEFAPRSGAFTLLLDDIRDPGNLGTILRIADWYGILHVVCSITTAELYNPKVIAASMGSFTRVSVFYCSLADYMTKYPLPVYGALLNGQNVHQIHFKESGMLLIGNESTGVSSELLSFINYPVTIPRVGKAESLNAGVATGIILDNLSRHK